MRSERCGIPQHLDGASTSAGIMSVPSLGAFGIGTFLVYWL